MKYLLLILFLGLVWHFFRIKKQPRPQSTTKPNPLTIKMVQCEYCGIHLPENEALIRHGHIWCNADHEKRGTQQ
ncbi:PP0621 family protein [Pelistega ratti]|uniref:PP0621 family protein n=1 Tax=Pelistega ratti TaxID=2652177 RepID=UPI001358A548|nr:PP0621 family protein [Pelistega ratti]